jgi:hypothetical protein
MNFKRLPILFLVVGIALKATLVFIWRLSHIPGMLKLLVYYDPGAHHFAEEMTRLFFYHGGFTFAPGAPMSFEVFLVIGFGIECLVLGFVVQWVLRRFGRSEGVRSMPTMH